MNTRHAPTLISGLVGILVYSKVILPITHGLWNGIHEIFVDQMTGAGFTETLVLALAYVISAVSIVGGGGFVFVAWTVALVQRLARG